MDCRRLLVRAMRDLLEREGPEVSVDRLCREAGCSKGGFYHHFASKRELLLEALASYEKRPADLPEVLVRLLPLARRDPDVARLLDRRERPRLAAADAVLAGATALGRAIAAARSSTVQP